MGLTLAKLVGFAVAVVLIAAVIVPAITDAWDKAKPVTDVLGGP